MGRAQKGGHIMNDERIVALYWERDEQAIRLTREQYGTYLFSIAFQLLANREDSEECENDTYLAAWNVMPPQRPNVLSAFLAKIIRNLSLKKWRQSHAQKRGGASVPLAFDELEDCIADDRSFREELEAQELAEHINTFLRMLGESERRVFVCRYFYGDPISDIAERFGFGESRVKTMLMRTRNKLRAHLEKEGWHGLPFPSPRDLPDSGMWLIHESCPRLVTHMGCLVSEYFLSLLLVTQS